VNDRVRRRREAERRSRLVRRGLVATGAVLIVVGLVAVALASRGPDAAAGPALTPLAAEGKRLAVQRSCVGCHGRSGEGTPKVAPAWVGLFGSVVALDNGATVLADHEYLVESIRDPRVKHVAGYGLMPVDTIPDNEIEAIVAYIEELTPPASTLVP
jgi:mono/diheme cytochrome c family protein